MIRHLFILITFVFMFHFTGAQENQTNTTSFVSTLIPSFSMLDIDQLVEIVDVSPELSLEGRKPLLLIHGWSFEGEPAPPSGGYWDNFKNYLKNDPELRANFKPYYVKYWSNYVSVKEIAAELRNKLEEAGLHEQKIIIMGHSMGGLVSRSFMNEQVFTKGISKNKKCGDNVDLLITLGSSHHGSPMANGPARNAEVSIFLQVTMNTVESYVFKETKYNEVNRSDLRWDNYDGLLNYQTYSDEKNLWLESLNTNTIYDKKTVCYSGSVTGEFIIPQNGNVDEQYKLGAWFMQQGFNFTNDGIVPVQSAQFAGHSIKAIRHFNGYNHADIIRGKSNPSELFNPLQTDLMKAAPLKLTWPNIISYVKHSQYRNIEWEASEAVQLINIYFSSDNGITYSLVASNVNASLEKYSWFIPDINSSACKIKIEDAAFANETAVSERSFTIFHNTIQVTSPSGNEYFVRYRNNTIKWIQAGLGNKVKITYVDALNRINKIIVNETATQVGVNSFAWLADQSLPPSNMGVVQIQLLELLQNFDDSEIYTFSSPAFDMLGDMGFTLLSPETSPTDFFGIEGEQLTIGTTYSAKWRAQGEIKFVEIFLCDKDKNILQPLATDTNGPKVEVEKATRFYVPERYGNEFYLMGKASSAPGFASIESYSEKSFRINKKVNIILPVQSDQQVSLRPCFEAAPIDNATGYTFYLQDTLPTDQYPSWQYESESPHFCVPAKIENELQPGTVYRLTAVAHFDTIASYPDQLLFKTAATPPWDFEMVAPLKEDSTEQGEIELIWTRSVGAKQYHVQLSQHNKTIFDTTLFDATDTTLVVPLTNAEFYSDILVEVHAENIYGETTATASFYRKFKTGVFSLSDRSKEIELINYPNPFSRSTTFEFNIPLAMIGKKAALEIYSLTGIKLETVLEETSEPGTRIINWNKGSLSSGLYLYQLSVGEVKFTRLMQIE